MNAESLAIARVRTRFAPSPTGDLHLGGAYVALASWVLARRARGAFVVRIEDLDQPRIVPGAEERILDDLAWLGLDWDEPPPLRQSARTAAYEAALARLTASGSVYPCDCSRAEIARVASAPHAGEELVYPGTCRDLDPARQLKRPPAIRLRVPDACAISFIDGAAGVIHQDVTREVGDFVVRRGDGIFAYQLAVVVDDLAMGVTDVVRGDDLLASTPRQLLLARLVAPEATAPRYTHLPLVVGPGGARLAKRTRGASVRALRAAGIANDEIAFALAHALGLTAECAPQTLREVARAAEGRELAWRKAPWPILERWARVA